MAVYQGMTYTQIKDYAITLAKKHGLAMEHAEAISVFDEAMMKVGEDINNADRIASTSWTSSVNILTSGYMYPDEVFGDATPLVYIPYEQFRELFLGSSSNKPSIDKNFYWTLLGNTLYVEPNVTGFTNLVIKYAPRFTTWETKSTVSEIPELQSEFRILVSWKICELLFPKAFDSKYKSMLKEKRSFMNKKKATGHAKYWDPFEGSQNYRRSGWPGTVRDDD